MAVLGCSIQPPSSDLVSGDDLTGSSSRTFQNGVSPSTSYAGARDTYLSQNAPTTNYGAQSVDLLDGDDPGGSGRDLSTLIQWDVSSIPGGSIVRSASIAIRVTNASSGRYEIYEMKRSWVESQATWSAFATGSGWEVAGASGTSDRGSTILGTVTASATGTYTVALDTSGVALVQAWVNDPSRNHGLVIANASTTDGVDFASSEASTTTTRPALTVSYDPAGTDAGTVAGDSGAIATDSGSSATDAGSAATDAGSLPPPSTGDYLIIRRADLLALPTTSSAYTRLKAYADSTWPAPSLVDQDRKHGTFVFAAALVYARTGDTTYRTRARNGIMAVIGTEVDSSTRTLSVGRQLGSYVLAADLIDLSGTDDSTFRTWLSGMRTRVFPAHGRWTTLQVCHEDSSNNWGGWCGASLIAASLYLGDTTDVARRVRVVKGFLGNRAEWNDFRGQDEKNGALSSDERSWACDASASGFIPINAACVKSGINLDGAIVGDAMRGGPLTWPVPSTGVMYTNETIQGLLIQLELLYQAGYNLWSYQSNCMRRAGDFLARTSGWNYGSISTGNAWLANRRLGTSYPRVTPSNSRMLVGYDWLWP